MCVQKLDVVLLFLDFDNQLFELIEFALLVIVKVFDFLPEFLGLFLLLFVQFLLCVPLLFLGFGYAFLLES